MADFAILVGISRYRDEATYPQLQGPLNDVENFRKWLLAENGGNVPPENIRQIVTAQRLQELASPLPDDSGELDWQPTKAMFDKQLGLLIQDQRNGDYIVRPGARLYLYFAGHGFSSDWESLPSAALVPANVFGGAMDDIPGTIYMEGIRKMALFGEIVLIMDCCRTLKRTGFYSKSTFEPFTSDQQEDVVVLSVYPVPKDGSAQERVLAEAGNKPVGVLTHSFIKALNEVPPDILGRVSDSAIANYLSLKWKAWYPDANAPPKPRLYVPTSAEKHLFFNSGRPLVEQTFSVPVNRSKDFAITLSTSTSRMLASISAKFNGNMVNWERELDAASFLDVEMSEPGQDGIQTFTLKLLPEQYKLDIKADPQRESIMFTPGNANVVL